MNRTQRRAAEREERKYFVARSVKVEGGGRIEVKSKVQRECVARWERNGITAEDLKRCHDEGFDDGYRRGAKNAITMIYAAVALTLHEQHRFGGKRITAFLNGVDKEVQESLCAEDIIEEVEKKFGYILKFDEPFERVQEREE